MQTILVVFTVLALSQSARAGQCLPIINSTATSAPNNEHPDDVSAMTEMRQYNFTDFTVAYYSRSPHGSTPENPRLLAFSEGERRVIAVGPSKNSDRNLELEKLEYDGFNQNVFEWKNGKWDKNPKRCMGCHGGIGTSARAVWEQYPFWAGFYGGIRTLEGREHTPHFITQSLKALNDNSRYEIAKGKFRDMSSREAEQYFLKMNLQLNRILNTWSLAIVQRDVLSFIKNNPDLKTALLAVVVDRLGGFDNFLAHIPPKYIPKDRSLEDWYRECLDDTRRIQAEYFRRESEIMQREGAYELSHILSGESAIHLNRSDMVAKLRFVVEYLGKHDMSRWGMDLARSYAFGSGAAFAGDEFIAPVIRGLQNQGVPILMTSEQLSDLLKYPAEWKPMATGLSRHLNAFR